MNIKLQHFKDQCIAHLDDCLRTVFTPAIKTRSNPANNITEAPLNDEERKKSEAFMRINHTGEVCAQALYRGQMAVAQKSDTLNMLSKACDEETDHLAWTAERISELQGHQSLLNLAWYSKSFFIGVIAGLAGDAISLGFIEETEQQVGRHLDRHLEKLSPQDARSRAIITQMREDELQHADHAKAAGGKPLPAPIKTLMAWQSKVMTTLTYWV